jgi:hypothetical protein
MQHQISGGFPAVAAMLCLMLCSAGRAELALVNDADIQPLLIHVQRLGDAMEFLGVPLPGEAKQKLAAAARSDNPGQALQLIQEALDPLCLLGVHINPESRVKVDGGAARPTIVQHGWSQFLVKVHNEAGVTAKLHASSPQAWPVFSSPAQRAFQKETAAPDAPIEAVRDRWMEMRMYDGRPLNPTLSGAKLEYRIIQVYSRDAGKRAAVISFDVGQGSQDIGFRNDVTVTFDAKPSRDLTFRVIDENGQPATAAFLITDALGRVYPSQAKRLAPDFAFHPQVYRMDGETVTLPPGKYTITVTRGPEYLKQTRQITMGDEPQTAEFKLQRWVDPSKLGWWSGDHHIHAAGCAHYEEPTEGVHAPDMMRHILGEDLKIGANLTWGPCFDYQKQFFTGKEDDVSQYPYLLRYDVEVSGFGSHQSGHLVLLRLKDQIYPGGDSKDHWPTLCLNTLKWAKAQGAIVGPAHSGWGLMVNGNELPIYEVPKFDQIGAMEYIVDVTHEVPGPDGKLVPAVDFISTVDTPYTWELNIWYHTLNAGFRTRISGETDFPCIYGERVGLGRAYVKVDDQLTYDKWCEGVQLGRAYVGDGRSHLMDFTVGGVEVGTAASEVRLSQSGAVDVTAKVAAMLPAEPDPKLSPYPPGDITRFANEIKPFWHIERARIGDTRNVKVELVVNGYPVADQIITADGTVHEVRFPNVKIDRSSWVTMRIAYSSHTNPVWVMVGDKPVRASRRSAEWCLKSVEQCWSQKQRFIKPGEMDDAIAAYDHARQVYRRIIAESDVE